jgi:endonuclease YncB( thermonuclease family)
VIDGDTIRVYHQQPNVRLVGFNAPETRRAECDAEADLGAKATRRLRDLIREGNLEFNYVKCSCPEGMEKTLRVIMEGIAVPSDRMEEMLVRSMIAEGLAVPFICARNSLPQNTTALV